jgi:hypothetical protein
VTPTAALEDAAGSLADPGGTVDTPAGTSPGGGEIEAARPGRALIPHGITRGSMRPLPLVS